MIVQLMPNIKCKIKKKKSKQLTLSDRLIFKPTSGVGDWYTRFDFLTASNFMSSLSTSSSSFTLSGELKTELMNADEYDSNPFRELVGT